MERDRLTIGFNRLMKYISTHTLTWSVTIPSTTMQRIVEISTHTLTWSVTANWQNRSLMT